MNFPHPIKQNLSTISGQSFSHHWSFNFRSLQLYRPIFLPSLFNLTPDRDRTHKRNVAAGFYLSVQTSLRSGANTLDDLIQLSRPDPNRKTRGEPLRRRGNLRSRFNRRKFIRVSKIDGWGEAALIVLISEERAREI